MPNPRGNPNLGKAAIAAGTTFSKDRQPEHKPGPKPSKIRAFIQANDLSLNDVRASIAALAEMNEEQLQAIGDNKEAPVLLRSFAKALVAELSKGLVGVESLLDRTFGKPSQPVELTQHRPITFDKSEDDDPKPKAD